MYDNQKKRLSDLELEVQHLKRHLGILSEMIATMAAQNANLSMALAGKSTSEAEEEIEKLVKSINQISSLHIALERKD